MNAALALGEAPPGRSLLIYFSSIRTTPAECQGTAADSATHPAGFGVSRHPPGSSRRPKAWREHCFQSGRMSTSILIVEDDERLRSAVARDLARRGFDVVTVASVDGALARFEEQTFDVVLTDLCMEGADGIELIETLNSVAPKTRPILMSAYASARDHQRAMQLGAVQVLCKPFTPAE